MRASALNATVTARTTATGLTLPRLVRPPTSDSTKLALIWVAVTAYNLFKPYHVDDAVHLAIARWIAAHPLHPMSGNLNLGGFKGPISGMNQPPLYFYLLAIWGSLLGYGEATMHALQSLDCCRQN